MLLKNETKETVNIREKCINKFCLKFLKRNFFSFIIEKYLLAFFSILII